MDRYYLIAGAWNFDPVDKGINVFAYDCESGEISFLKNYDPQVGAGQQCFDAKRQIVYVVDECENHLGETGGGGFVRAYRLRGNGDLEFINETCVLMSKPAFVFLDKSGAYLLVACHSGRANVTKVIHDAKGNWNSAVLYDDAGVALIRINEDGSLGSVCDVALHEGLTANKRQVHAHPHSVTGSPDGSVYYVPDKGLDRIYAYRVNRESGKLICLGQKEMEYATAPRYGAFHPTLPVYFENNETGTKFYAFHYDSKSGYLEEINHVEICEPGGGAPSDIALHPNGKVLYTAVRSDKNPLIQAIRIDSETGTVTIEQTIGSGKSARGLCVSPDGRFLFAASDGAHQILRFPIDAIGHLGNGAVAAENIACAANVRILKISEYTAGVPLGRFPLLDGWL